MKLETERLILRPWQREDIDDLIEGLNNIKVSQWLVTVPYPYTAEDAERWIRFCQEIAKKKEPDGYEFAVELKSEAKVIGGVTLKRVNHFQGTAGGGIWLNEKYHGSGYGTEAYGERIRFAFEDLKLRRLENGYLEGNHASLKMQEKFGYRVEGKRRKGFLCMADGKLKDEYITGLLKEEWNRDY